jgi:hypothetical protein
VSEIRCPSCDIVLTPAVIAEGWCDECGKKIPEFLHTKRTNPANPVVVAASPDAKPWAEREHQHEPQAAAEPDDPDADELPRITERYEPRSDFIWAGALVLGSVILFLCCYPFGLLARIIGGVVGGSLLVIALCLVFYELKIMPSIRRDLRALQDGEYLAKWDYTAREWLKFVRAEWKSGRWWTLAIILGLVAALGALPFWGQKLTRGESIAVNLLFCFGLISITAGCIFLALATSENRRGWQAVRTTYIGNGLVCFNGRHYVWNRLGFRLAAVRVVLGEQNVLELDIRGYRNTGPTVRILVPHGKLDEAHEVVRKLGGGGQ